MYKLKTSACFDSAHFLAGYEGKCANIHGHCWKIEAVICGDTLNENGTERGMLVDFGEFKKAVRELANEFDHTLIFEKDTLKPSTFAALRDEGFSLTEVVFRPTAENLAEYFFGLLESRGLPITSVTVYETPENAAVYEVER